LNILTEVSIIVPTKNRSSWCKRLVNYYSRNNFPGILIFCDSSNAQHFGDLQSHINKESRLKVIQLSLPRDSVHSALQVGIQTASIHTRFFAQSGDDDIYSIAGLARAATFLSANSEYACCIGKSVIAGYATFGDKVEQKWLRKYGHPRSLTQSSPNERVFEITSKYYNLEFSLRRTDLGLHVIHSVNDFLGTLPFKESTRAEYCSVIGIAYSGKVKVISEPFLLRIDHADRPNNIQLTSDELIALKTSQLEIGERFHLNLGNPEKLGHNEILKLNLHYEVLRQKIKRREKQKTFLTSRILVFLVRVGSLLIGNLSKIKFQRYYQQYMDEFQNNNKQGNFD